jgi:hypothetical protein
MRTWFYEKGGALLLSGNAFNAFRCARDVLLAPDDETDPTEVSNALSTLRTELKIDISSRQPSERAVEFAPSEEQRWGG